MYRPLIRKIRKIREIRKLILTYIYIYICVRECMSVVIRIPNRVQIMKGFFGTPHEKNSS